MTAPTPRPGGASEAEALARAALAVVQSAVRIDSRPSRSSRSAVPDFQIEKLRRALAAFEADASPAWTSEAPKVPGLYWMFREEGRLPSTKPLLVTIAAAPDGKLWLVADWGEFLLEPESGHSDGFVWQGPIAVPVAP